MLNKHIYVHKDTLPIGSNIQVAEYRPLKTFYKTKIV